PSPLGGGYIPADDERDKRPPLPASLLPLPASRQDIEIMPLRPRVAIGNAVTGQMKVIDLVAQLEGCWRNPPAIAVVVLPAPANQVGRRADQTRRVRYLAAGVHGVFTATWRTQIQQPALDLRRDRSDLVRIGRRSYYLPVKERGVIDRKEQTADTAGLHYLDVQSLGKHGNRPATNQLFLARLRQECLPHRQQNDHHRYTDAESKEHQHRSPRTVSEIAQRQLADHCCTTRPSRM